MCLTQLSSDCSCGVRVIISVQNMCHTSVSPVPNIKPPVENSSLENSKFLLTILFVLYPKLSIVTVDLHIIAQQSMEPVSLLRIGTVPRSSTFVLATNEEHRPPGINAARMKDSYLLPTPPYSHFVFDW
jgi:hypothetical protein